jgi:hypothetical protein
MKKTLFFVGIILALILIGCNKPKITCEIVKPTPNATFEIGETIDLAVTVNVENTSIDQVQIYLDDVGYAQKNFFPFNFQIRTQDMEKGFHTIRVVALANSGDKDEKTISFSLEKYESPDFVSFSDGQIPKGWTNHGWTITSPGYDDDYSIRARVCYSDNLYVTKTCDPKTYIEFYAKKDDFDEWSYNQLRFYIDNQQVESIELTPEWERYSFPVPAGEHTFIWYPGGNCDRYIYLDAIKFYKE